MAAFPKLGATLTVEFNGLKITGQMTKIRPQTQTAFIETGNDKGTWVPVDVIRKKYCK